MNTQKPTGPTNEPSEVYIHEHFVSIQGEGPFAGTPALFIRLAGCNLACPGCDTEYSNHTAYNMDELDQLLPQWLEQEHGCRPQLIVVTGGEPFRQSLHRFLNVCLDHAKHVQVETNGTLDVGDQVSHMLDVYDSNLTLVCSPKGRIANSIKRHCKHFKFVIGWDGHDLPETVLGNNLPIPEKDLDWVRQRHDYRKVTIYIQPQDYNKDTLNRLARDNAVALCMLNNYRLCLQLHKLIGVQ